MKYKVGDKVRIVSQWGPHCNQNPEGRMDKYLGTVMTIRDTSDGKYFMEEDKHDRIAPLFSRGWVWNEHCIAGRVGTEKIVVTVEGAVTTARMYCGKTVIKTAKAQCSPLDEFDFKVGAALAVDRLLGRETAPAQEPAAFRRDMLLNGRFGRMSDGKWFVVVGDRLVYLTKSEGFDNVNDVESDGAFSLYRTDCIVAAVSLFHAKQQARDGKFIWVRPGAKFD